MSLPNDFPEWAINDPLKVEVPLTPFANDGYNNTDKPSFKHINFFFNRLSLLYNAVINGIFDDKGVNPVTSQLEYEIIQLKGRVSELEYITESLKAEKEQ